MRLGSVECSCGGSDVFPREWSKLRCLSTMSITLLVAKIRFCWKTKSLAKDKALLGDFLNGVAFELMDS